MTLDPEQRLRLLEVAAPLVARGGSGRLTEFAERLERWCLGALEDVTLPRMTLTRDAGDAPVVRDATYGLGATEKEIKLRQALHQAIMWLEGDAAVARNVGAHGERERMLGRIAALKEMTE